MSGEIALYDKTLLAISKLQNTIKEGSTVDIVLSLHSTAHSFRAIASDTVKTMDKEQLIQLFERL